MLFNVCTAQGDVIYNGGSWPMARAALEHLIVIYDGGSCPQLTITQLPEKEP